jgi:hypothetical protein
MDGVTARTERRIGDDKGKRYIGIDIPRDLCLQAGEYASDQETPKQNALQSEDPDLHGRSPFDFRPLGGTECVRFEPALSVAAGNAVEVYVPHPSPWLEPLEAVFSNSDAEHRSVSPSCSRKKRGAALASLAAGTRDSR